MTGQITYTKKTKSWKHITSENMTMASCRLDNTIQSRNGGNFMAWSGGFVNNGPVLADLIDWIERTA